MRLVSRSEPQTQRSINSVWLVSVVRARRVTLTVFSRRNGLVKLTEIVTTLLKDQSN